MYNQKLDYVIEDEAFLTYEEAIQNIKRNSFTGNPIEWNYMVDVKQYTKTSFKEFEKIFDLTAFPKGSLIIVCPYASINYKDIHVLRYAMEVRSDCKFLIYQRMNSNLDWNYRKTYPATLSIDEPNVLVCLKLERIEQYFLMKQSKKFQTLKGISIANYCNEPLDFQTFKHLKVVINETNEQITANCDVVSKGQSIPEYLFKLTNEPEDVNFLEKGDTDGNSLEW